MKVYQLAELIEDRLDDAPYEATFKQITVHTGGDNYEEVVDVVFCQECDQYHIISERIASSERSKLENLSDTINIPMG